VVTFEVNHKTLTLAQYFLQIPFIVLHVATA